MFYLDRNQELTASILNKMINRFNLEVLPQRVHNQNYYDGKQKILNRYYNDSSKPNSRVITNFCKNIVESYTGYLATPGYISYKTNEEIDIEPIMEVLRYNDYQTEDCDFLHNYLIYGFAAELMYVDEDAQLRFKLIDPLTCFAISDDNLSGDLRYFVRIYKENEWDDSNLYFVDVYSDNEIKHYKMAGTNGMVQFISAEPHYFTQCPVNIFDNIKEESIFDCIVSLQDAYNEVSSDEVDDYSAFCDAYLTITGAELDGEDVALMKENRVIMLPTDATAQWLTKANNDAQTENILKRFQASIYRIAQCPDFSSESFVGGVSSGIAIRYRLTGMETRAAGIMSLMKKALQRRIEIISGFASLRLGIEVFRDVDIVFTRNIPDDNSSILQLVQALKGTVSETTLLSQIPFITDVQKEVEQIEKEKTATINLYSSYSAEDAAKDEAEIEREKEENEKEEN